ncbi:5-oxoprolinase subunit B/C family protein [Arthrobacter koreensis]|uniref:5-oxoprolinase subunit B/C family protein n=1 Tax=Arthrobacter koreensis TaxID=199136 RepID=UPI002DB8E549|nr:5-oxoprolinase/urea amidolyase family protein [Arthrobacter koreensis]MEB7449205.1 5-oxoprolinase/urea amidolyase family protein [Arthrobacter koreensis]
MSLPHAADAPAGTITGIRPAGTGALLVELGSLADVVALHTQLKSHPLPGQVDALAAAATVLVRFASRRDAVAGLPLLQALDFTHADTAEPRTVTIETVYDGADLAEVARLTGLSEEAVVNAHTGTAWTAGFGGFAPGFTYLTGGDPALNVPRRSSPRTAVPPGAVALAGDYSAVYPRESPGGWQLIGRTAASMWDLSRPNPALISPGDLVQFTPIREFLPTTSSPFSPAESRDADTSSSPEAGLPASGSGASVSPASPSEERAGSEGSGRAHLVSPASPSEERGGSEGSGFPLRACEEEGGGAALRDDEMPAPTQGDHCHLEITNPGLQSLIQDLGRPGYADLGVSAAGAADPRAARQANRLVGNPADAAVVENLLGSLELTAHGDAVLALTGADVPADVIDPAGVRSRPAPHAAPFALLDGETLRLGVPVRGVRAYLAVRGGLDVDPVLGSRSTDSMSGIGPAPLAAGTRLPVAAAGSLHVGDPEAPVLAAAGVPGTLGNGIEPALLRITAGPRQDWFSNGAAAALAGQTWLTTSESNRIGVRLALDPQDTAASPLTRARDGELPSEGVVAGSLQVPPSGLPVLFLADHPVTGGYPVIAVVIPEDLPVAAQLSPGDPVRFIFVDPDTLAPLTAEQAVGLFPEGTE